MILMCYPRLTKWACALAQRGYWQTLRVGDKSRGTQTKARLAAYAGHPLHQQTTHQFGFVMLTATDQAGIDADHTARTAGGWASKKTTLTLDTVARRSA